MIKITFPDGAVREFESGVTTFEIAQSISNSLAKKALAGKFNGKLIDTTRAITEDGSIEIVTPDHKMLFQSCVTQQLTCLPKQLVAFSQTFTWELAQPIEDGFYYDTDNTAGQISNERPTSYRRRNAKNCQRKLPHLFVKKSLKTKPVKSSRTTLTN